jgi:hypothetical protein
MGGTPWLTRPLLIRIADSVMLPLNLIMALGLWRARLWGVLAWLACILLFTDHFASSPMERGTLYTLLAAHATLVGDFLFLLLSLRRADRNTNTR